MIAIIKYNAGNVQSVQYALQRIGVESVVTDDEVQIRQDDKVIIPGVGSLKSLRFLKLDGTIFMITSQCFLPAWKMQPTCTQCIVIMRP